MVLPTGREGVAKEGKRRWNFGRVLALPTIAAAIRQREGTPIHLSSFLVKGCQMASVKVRIIAGAGEVQRRELVVRNRALKDAQERGRG